MIYNYDIFDFWLFNQIPNSAHGPRSLGFYGNVGRLKAVWPLIIIVIFGIQEKQSSSERNSKATASTGRKMYY